jgi:hypothetical protein
VNDKPQPLSFSQSKTACILDHIMDFISAGGQYMDKLV